MAIYFRDAAHIQAYCKGHFAQPVPATPGSTGMDFVTEMKIVGVAVLVGVAWYIGKDGWTGLKALYAGIRNLFSGTKTSTTTTTVATTSAVTPATPVA